MHLGIRFEEKSARTSKIVLAIGWFITVVLLLIMGGCGGSSSNNSVTSNQSGTTNSSGNAGIPRVQHVAIVVLENTNYADVVGSPNAPYINSLIAKGGLASNYYANVHPSIGNYFAMTTGAIPTTDDYFMGVVSNDNVVREMVASGKSWKSYAQSLPVQGYFGPDIYPYLRQHNPFSYLSDVVSFSTQVLNLVPFAQFSTDLAANQLPNYVFITPDAEHDAHDCPGGLLTTCDIGVKVAAADSFLSSNMPQLLSNAGFQQSGLLLIVFDESADDNTNGGGKVVCLLLGTGVKPGYTGTGTYNHYSLLNLSMTALGVSNVPGAGATATPMTEFFQ